jgi:hypothetical protein
LLLLETFVDPQRFTGTLYRAANWLDVGETRGLRRQRGGDRTTRHPPKRVFLRPLTQTARAVLACAVLEPRYRHRGPRLMSSAEPMRALPASFTDIPDPRRAQGRRHALRHARLQGDCRMGRRPWPSGPRTPALPLSSRAF